MFKLKVRKIGNSLGTLLSADAVAMLKVQEGDELFIVEDVDGFRITAYDPEFEQAVAVFEKGRRKFRNALRKLAE